MEAFVKHRLNYIYDNCLYHVFGDLPVYQQPLSMQNNNQKPDPWGRDAQKPSAPPDLDALLNDLKKKIFDSLKQKGPRKPYVFNQNFSTGSPSFFLALVGIILFILWFLSGIFIVSPAERAVITRFGRYIETLDSGPHWIPRLIEARKIINVQRISTYAYQSEMLTQDENIVSVAVAVQYRVGSAKDYLFSVVDPVRSLEQATASALRQVVGHNTLDNLLTIGLAQTREQVAQELQRILGLYKAGIIVTDVTLQAIKPPRAVTAAFDDAVKAKEDQQAYINQADAYTNKVLGAAQGRSARILWEAEAFKQEVLLEAKAATAEFSALLPEYRASPLAMRQRLYLSTLETIFSKTPKVFLDASHANPLIYLPLDRLSQASPASASAYSAQGFSSGVSGPLSPSPSPLPSLQTPHALENLGAIADPSKRPDYPSEHPVRGENS